MSLDDQFFSDLEQDRESMTRQLYFLESLKTNKDHLEQSGEYSVTNADKNDMLFLVKECEEVESRILRNPNSSTDSYEVESCDDQLNEVNSSGATLQASSNVLKKSSLGGVQENNDGFKTPTKFLDNELGSNGLRCPPAPRKPKANPLGKRKRVCNNLQIEFVNEVESALRLLINGDHLKLKKVRS